ncbi:hypothetical protein [Microbacterium maritypicum]
MTLNRERVSPWYERVDALQYSMQVDDLVTDAGELREAIDAGMRIGIFSGTASVSSVSLRFLAPVIGEIRDLWVNSERVTDIDVLDGALSLRSLEFEVEVFDGRMDLSQLPHLEEFRGAIKRSTATVLNNPRLRILTVDGAIPKSFPRISGPVEKFVHFGARSQTELPEFAHPEELRSIQRGDAARFDLAQLASFTGVEDVEVSSCADVTGLSTLSRLPELSRVVFNHSATTESWDDLPPVADGVLIAVSPNPSQAFLEARRAAGWLVPALYELPVEAISIDVAADGESWGVYMSRFDDLGEAVDALDGSMAHGLHGEQFILGVVAELRASGDEFDPEPDSEGDFTAVYFPTREQAERVFESARELLGAHTATKVAIMGAGAEWVNSAPGGTPG